MKPKKILMLAILSGLLTTGLFYIFMQQISPAEAIEPETVQVVAASSDIEENVQLTEENLELIEILESEKHSGAIEDKEAIVGEYTSTFLAEGEVLLNHRIQNKEHADTMSKKVAEGHRAVSISVDYVKSVSNLIEPEDSVDVILTPFAENTEEETEPADILMEDVKVLAVGQRMVEKMEGEASNEYIAVTLELEQEDAVVIVDASDKGTLQLILSSSLKESAEVEDEEVLENEDVGDEEQASVEPADDLSSDVIVLPEKAFLRSTPSLTGNVLNVVEAGTSLIISAEEEADEDGRLWVHIETESGQQGWISSRIIKLNNE